MTSARFSACAKAYGGAINRWPEAERRGSLTFADNEDGRALLARESRLDAQLSSYAIEAPSRRLRAQILRQGVNFIRRRRKLLFWRSATALAGVGLAGALAGALALHLLTPRILPEGLGLRPSAAVFVGAGLNASQRQDR
jgi:hypothetical protein